jgi:hypothetical protein
MWHFAGTRQGLGESQESATIDPVCGRDGGRARIAGFRIHWEKLAYLPVDPILDLNFDALPPIGLPEEVEVSGAERTSFYPSWKRQPKSSA